MMSASSGFRSIDFSRISALFIAFSLSSITSFPAYSISFESGEVYGSWDTTVSYGRTHRVQKPAAELIGISNGGTALSNNGDDGNLNYADVGVISNTVKFTTELEVNYRNFGAFVRGTGFKDTQADDINDGQRTPLADKTIRLNGENVSLLDAYVWGNFDIGNMPFSLRVGEQVISWGESTFIQNSINVINPVDVSKLRVPGAELKEALTPVGIVSASLGVTDNVSVEAYWQYDYERIRIDPTGSYFSTNDFAGANGSFVTLGFGRIPDYLALAGPGGPLTALPDVPFAIFPPGVPGSFYSATRAPDQRPDQGDEYGVALRVYAPALNDTEFGFYHIKYHSRLPIINAIAGVSAGAAPLNPTGAKYFISFPEDINLFGVSFNTQFSNSGWALQGEYSFRKDAPLQVDDVEILAAALHFEELNGACGFFFGGSCTSQLGVFGAGAVVPGFIERDISQFQMTATQIYSNVFKAEQAVVLGEVAITYVHDMPSQSVLRLDAAGTSLPGNAATAGILTLGSGALVPQETNNFADATSWGYRLVGRLTYNNVIGAVNLSPRIGWRHDVNGNTPGPGGNFIEGFKQVTVGLAADYQNTWKADLSYTSFFGAGSQNLLQDRDFVAASISYSF
jgi:uncharacterized protein DUF1302